MKSQEMTKMLETINTKLPLVSSETRKFIEDFQKAKKATREHSIQFGESL